PSGPAVGGGDASADHRRQAGHRGAAGQRRVPPPAAAPQQARHDRRGPLHVGGRSGRVRRAGHGLVGRGLRHRGIGGGTVISERSLESSCFGVWGSLVGRRREVDLIDSKAGTLQRTLDRKSTRLNSSHLVISYVVFCLNKKYNILIVVLNDYI